ncbi:hypothetical protein HMPREF0972_00103 [Actinomyces sp. oral taxon 848 str. F0332]|nr:hypothetical protein HMPREF0972_00103 [Actinomyces sp. oral taxon 848 str. F0332]
MLFLSATFFDRTSVEFPLIHRHSLLPHRKVLKTVALLVGNK